MSPELMLALWQRINQTALTVAAGLLCEFPWLPIEQVAATLATEMWLAIQDTVTLLRVQDQELPCSW